MFCANCVMISTGREPLPAITEPNQSTNKSSARAMTSFGMSAIFRLAAKLASSLDKWGVDIKAPVLVKLTLRLLAS